MESYDPRHALWLFSNTTLCVHCKPIHTLLFGMQIHIVINYIPNNGFTANSPSFYKNKVLRHNLQATTVHSISLHIPVSFQLQWMLLIHIQKQGRDETHKTTLLQKNHGKERLEEYCTSVA